MIPDIFNFAFLGGAAGPGELMIIFVVVLVFFGPRRLPDIARKLGKIMRELRGASDDFRRQVMNIENEHLRDDTDIQNKDNSTSSATIESPYVEVDEPDSKSRKIQNENTAEHPEEKNEQ